MTGEAGLAEQRVNKDAIAKALAESIRRQRGYADFFDWSDKSLKEWGIAQSFVEELHRDCGPIIAAGKQHPGGANYAPDFQLDTTSGEVWGIEITEFVSQDAIHQTKRGKAVLAEWPDEELVAEFRRIVARKDQPEKIRGGPYDRYGLLMHTDEPMFNAERLSAVLARLDIETRTIDEVYVLLSYDPGVKRCPLLVFKAHRH